MECAKQIAQYLYGTGEPGGEHQRQHKEKQDANAVCTENRQHKKIMQWLMQQSGDGVHCQQQGCQPHIKGKNGVCSCMGALLYHGASLAIENVSFIVTSQSRIATISAKVAGFAVKVATALTWLL